MSKAGVQAVVNKAMADETFRKKLKENPGAALSGFDLTPEEINAFKSGDKAKLQQLGVDERISKVYLPAVDMLSTNTTPSPLGGGIPPTKK